MELCSPAENLGRAINAGISVQYRENCQVHYRSQELTGFLADQQVLFLSTCSFFVGIKHMERCMCCRCTDFLFCHVINFKAVVITSLIC